MGWAGLAIAVIVLSFVCYVLFYKKETPRYRLV